MHFIEKSLLVVDSSSTEVASKIIIAQGNLKKSKREGSAFALARSRASPPHSNKNNS